MKLMEKEEILKMLIEVYRMNPYKEPGNTESYSSYNEGWVDCINEIEKRIG